jgi:hypothetical protein
MEKEKRRFNPNADDVFLKNLVSDKGKGYLRVPNIWITDLIADEKEYPHISASFWKFLLVLWHEIMRPRTGKPDWTAKLAMRDFGIRAADADKWAAALGVSRLFTVVKGTKEYRNRSTFTYNTDSTTMHWQGL